MKPGFMVNKKQRLQGFKRQRLSKDRSSITAVPEKYQVFVDLVGRG